MELVSVRKRIRLREGQNPQKYLPYTRNVGCAWGQSPYFVGQFDTDQKYSIAAIFGGGELPNPHLPALIEREKKQFTRFCGGGGWLIFHSTVTPPHTHTHTRIQKVANLLLLNRYFHGKMSRRTLLFSCISSDLFSYDSLCDPYGIRSPTFFRILFVIKTEPSPHPTPPRERILYGTNSRAEDSMNTAILISSSQRLIVIYTRNLHFQLPYLKFSH